MRTALLFRVLIFFVLTEGALGFLLYLSEPLPLRLLLCVTMGVVFMVCLAGFLYAWFDR